MGWGTILLLLLFLWGVIRAISGLFCEYTRRIIIAETAACCFAWIVLRLFCPQSFAIEHPRIYVTLACVGALLLLVPSVILCGSIIDFLSKRRIHRLLVKAKKGNSKAIVKLGNVRIDLDGGFFNENACFLWWRKAARAGNARAMRLLGEWSSDPVEEREWYLKAARLGDVEAQDWLWGSGLVAQA